MSVLEASLATRPPLPLRWRSVPDDSHLASRIGSAGPKIIEESIDMDYYVKQFMGVY